MVVKASVKVPGDPAELSVCVIAYFCGPSVIISLRSSSRKKRAPPPLRLNPAPSRASSDPGNGSEAAPPLPSPLSSDASGAFYLASVCCLSLFLLFPSSPRGLVCSGPLLTFARSVTLSLVCAFFLRYFLVCYPFGTVIRLYHSLFLVLSLS